MSRIGWIAALLALASACSGSDQAADPAGIDFGTDMPPELLIEIPPENESQRLLRRAQQTTPLCVMASNLETLDEPLPDDVDELFRYAQSSYNQLFSLDPESKVRDPDVTSGSPREVPLPTALIDAARRARTQMYAYLVRVRTTRQLLDEGRIDTPEADARLANAFLRLAASEYTEADRQLTAFAARACR